MTEVTQLLGALDQNDPTAAGQLLPLVYEELRRLAAQRMALEAPGHTLQPTALVHEAWLRLVAAEPHTWQNRAHFFGAASEAMRRVLIDRARAKNTHKRGNGAQPLDLDRVDVAVEADEESLLRVDAALNELGRRDPQSAQLVKLRFFVGLNYEEAAKIMGLSERTAKRCWIFARAWLYRELSRTTTE